MLLGAMRLGVAFVLLAPLLIPLYALAMGIIQSAKEETNGSDRVFLVIYATALLVIAMVLVGTFRALLLGR